MRGELAEALGMTIRARNLGEAVLPIALTYYPCRGELLPLLMVRALVETAG